AASNCREKIPQTDHLTLGTITGGWSMQFVSVPQPERVPFRGEKEIGDWCYMKCYKKIKNLPTMDFQD
ncbi:MAG: hypothetical protein KDA68_13360, partial [Planctomycetaceae bacterium]|nr:hypothetical protein [Planctomycetaceae bacterium]